ncbi:Fe-S-biosyn domain-containing protein [Fusarium falciforme]|uniref:Fe-S-biosyn domain-containing protein n=1 Tax=Fusarium falciforme TaxID=195108 RepID=UPI002301F7D2|nr:Fe-S-biosyn domain-containing protein [Fusarium falciforme]WAO89140.1 Fe-S-biosyn domain-containing protein [Fusarium falciforme]
MFATRSVARVALRRAPNAVRYFSSSRPVAVAYHSYTLPSHNAPPPRGDDVPETSITQPDPLPKVHETRPPPQQPQRPQPPQQPQPQHEAPSQNAAPAIQKASAPVPKLNEKEAQKPKAARPRPKLRARKAAMKLTPAAVEQLREMLDQPDPKLIKVGVRNRGCSGLAYHLEYVDKPGAFDETVEQDGVKVLIDSKALFSIIGSEMDWAEDKLNQRFVFRNPNIKEQCGCGESFMV